MASLRWARWAEKVGLAREDEIAAAAAQIAADLSAMGAGPIPASAWRPLPRHRAMRAMMKIEEMARRSKNH